MLVSNQEALDAMAGAASDRGYRAVIAGADRFDEPRRLVTDMLGRAEPRMAVVAGGEPALRVPEGAGAGGRNQHTALVAATMLSDGQVFASLASDGMDNGPHAGGLVDTGTRERADGMGFDDRIARFDDTAVLLRTGDCIETGPTGANVSDLLLLLTGNENG